jgi:adenosylhomocysteine nucleosidase
MIGILTAMDSEMLPLLTLLEGQKRITLGPRTFIEGSINGNPVVLAVAGIGKVASTLTATLMLQYFKVDCLIFAGVAGGVSDEVSVGDLVLGEATCQHDMDCSPLYEPHVVPAIGVSHFKADPGLLSQFEQLAQQLGFKVHRGLIVSGDQFVDDVVTAQKIMARLKGVRAIEMEGAAVAQVCHEYAIPHLVFRIISDKADSEASGDYLAFMDSIGCWVARDLISAFLKG